MSYDLTIQGGSEEVLSNVQTFIRGLPGMKANGERGFVYQPNADLRMELDLEYVNAEGDSISDQALAAGKLNQINLHIPYAYFTETKLQTYSDVARTIAAHLNWKVSDQQSATTTQSVAAQSMPTEKPVGRASWNWVMGVLALVIVFVAAMKLFKKP